MPTRGGLLNLRREEGALGANTHANQCFGYASADERRHCYYHHKIGTISTGTNRYSQLTGAYCNRDASTHARSHAVVVRKLSTNRDGTARLPRTAG